MPGFKENAGFGIENLSDGINVIYGPNGSGKTTAARAMNALLWPDLSPEPSEVTGFFSADDTAWQVTILDGARTDCRKNGRSSPPPPLPAAEAADRYNFALPDLLQESPEEFAQAIVRETTGGYDLAKAEEETGARNKTSSWRISEKSALDQARKKVQEIRSEQSELKKQERDLHTLSTEKARAGRRAAEKELLQAAINKKDAEANLHEIEEELKQYPNALRHFTGTDADDLDTLKKRIADEENALKTSQERYEKAAADLKAAGLSSHTIPSHFVSSLRQKKDRLSDLQGRIEQHATGLAGLELEKKELIQSSQPLFPGELRPHLTLEELTEIATFARKAERLRIKLKHNSDLQAQYKTQAPADDPAALLQGKAMLAAWLALPAADPALSMKLTVLGIVSGAASALAAVLCSISWWFAPLCALSAAACFLAFHTQRNRQENRKRTFRQEEFEALELTDRPASWTEKDVTEALQAILGRIAASEHTREEQLKRKQAEEEHAQLVDEKSALERKRDALVQRTGAAPEGEGQLDEAVFYLFAERLHRLEKTAEAEAHRRAEYNELKEQFRVQHEALNSELAPFGYSPSPSVEDAAAQVDDLAERMQKAERARDAADHAKKDIENTNIRSKRLREEYHTFFEKRKLEPGDEAALADYCKLVPRFQQVERTYRDRKAVFESTDRQLRSFEAWKQTEDKTGAELKEALEKASVASQQAEELNRRITRITTLIDETKRKQALEAALADEQERRYALRRKREEDYRAVITWELLRYLKEQTRDRCRPPVFHRAQELLLLITDGRYRLELSDDTATLFYATDTTTGEVRQLDELSSGTRVQMLLAVRAAFIELEEGGASLPLFLDETLANSDDRRTPAIIQSIIKLAETGRQVFYFTAQEDELHKWRAMLEKPGGPPFAFHNLSGEQSRQYAEKRPPLAGISTIREVPPPTDEERYTDYGERIDVPPVDPYRRRTESIHLWYLFESSGELYEALSRGITTWGQLKALASAFASGSSDAALSASLFARAEASAKAFQEAQRIWQAGRGRKVDRDALKESGQVTSTFLQPVYEKLKEVQGDGRALITALENREVAKFKTAKRHLLKAFFEENGYIDSAEPVGRTDAYVRVLEAMKREIEQNTITPRQVQRIVNCIYHTAGFSSKEKRHHHEKDHESAR